MYDGVHSSSATSTATLGDAGAAGGGGAVAGGPSPVDKLPRDGERDSQPRGTQYLTSNCVLFTYFSGDPATVVDEHFSRALSQPSSYSLDKPGVHKNCTRPGEWCSLRERRREGWTRMTGLTDAWID